METFFLAMCTHPLAQRAAQAELDNVIGNDRLPSMADRAQLPYIDALMKEVLRWSPIAPMGELSMFCHFIIDRGSRHILPPPSRNPASPDAR